MPAKQPTSFTLDTYELDVVFDSPELISSLAVYSHERHLATTAQGAGSSLVGHHEYGEVQQSALFLRVLASASYFSDDEARMRHVEPVFVDIILDPYILNVLPQTLIPTAAYVVVVAGLAWFSSQYIRGCLNTPYTCAVSAHKKTA